jgi:hypothetical protein
MGVFFLAISILMPPILIGIYWFTLKKEKEGCIKITEAAQELNNKTLHEAGESLYIANSVRFKLCYLSITLYVVYLFLRSF